MSSKTKFEVLKGCRGKCIRAKCQQVQPTNAEISENTVTTIVGEVEVTLVYFPASFGKVKEVNQLVRVHNKLVSIQNVV